MINGLSGMIGRRRLQRLGPRSISPAKAGWWKLDLDFQRAEGRGRSATPTRRSAPWSNATIDVTG